MRISTLPPGRTGATSSFGSEARRRTKLLRCRFDCLVGKLPAVGATRVGQAVSLSHNCQRATRLIMTDNVLATFAAGILSSQSAVVTGGSGGVGRAVCLALARAGANLVVGYHSDAGAAHAVCEEATALGVRAVPIQVNVAQADEVYRFMEQANGALGPVDILVNSAGTWPEAKIWEMDDQQWHDALAVNLNGTYYACKAASKVMIQRRSGKIVNFSSIAAARGARSGHAHYAAAKGGVAAFTRSLANELGPYGINVNAVAPGIIRTKMTEQALEDRGADYHSQIPLGRIGLPEEVAGLVLFLVSPAARYITGQTIHVNGGMWMS